MHAMMPIEYGDATYWDERYSRNLTQQGFDWYVGAHHPRQGYLVPT
jgi:hypothetical protein